MTPQQPPEPATAIDKAKPGVDLETSSARAAPEPAAEVNTEAFDDIMAKLDSLAAEVAALKEMVEKSTDKITDFESHLHTVADHVEEVRTKVAGFPDLQGRLNKLIDQLVKLDENIKESNKKQATVELQVAPNAAAKPDEIVIEQPRFKRLWDWLTSLFRSTRERLRNWGTRLNSRRAQRRASAVPWSHTVRRGLRRTAVAVIAVAVVIVALNWTIGWYGTPPTPPKKAENSQQQAANQSAPTKKPPAPQPVVIPAPAPPPPVVKAEASPPPTTPAPTSQASAEVKQLGGRVTALEQKVNTPVPDSYYEDLYDAIVGKK